MNNQQTSTWLILPRDPLIFRDGRPFEPVPGARARTLPFPYPVTLIGALRTREGFLRHQGDFDNEDVIKTLLQRQVVGPFLAEVDTQGALRDWYLPAPQDALWVKRQNQIYRYWLRPVTIPEAAMNMPKGLTPVGPIRRVKEKPYRYAPMFWTWEAVQEWLTHPKDSPAEPDAVGIQSLPQEPRTHVKIVTETQTAQEGFLFQTTGLRFLQVSESADWPQARSFALLVNSDADVDEGVGFLGGERRAVYWRQVDWSLPSPPEEVLQSAEQGAVRMMLVTPAAFESGYLPTWVQDAIPGVRVQVVGIALVQRAVTISGWDLKKREEKPSRRLVPAGAVYYLRLKGESTARRRFVESMWFQAISDGEQDRRDGLGQVIFGVWDGNVQEVKDAQAE